MKILLVQNGWSGQGISGGDKHTLESAGFWKEENVIHVLLPASGINFLKKHFASTIDGYVLHPLWSLLDFARLTNLAVIILSYNLRLVFSGLQILTLGKFDAVISCSHFLYDVLPAVSAKMFFRSRVVVYVYHLVSLQGRRPSLRNKFSSFGESLSLVLIKNFADAVFVDNQATYQELIKKNFNLGRIHFTRVGIKRCLPSQAEKKIYDLCFVGRLVKSKGVFDLPEVVGRVKSSFAAISVVVLGGGDEVGPLRRILYEKDLTQNVKMLGFVTEAEKFKLLSQSRIFVSPSYEEGWGIAVAEAMECGLPVVAYELPALREVFGEAPIYSKTGDIDGLARAVENLLANTEFYRRKSEEGKAAVARYMIDKVAAEELKVIRSL
ncbi:MAG: glycosyltransferase family 4 protein [Patescibacteria group bacterium]|nr:glycosyltransferase family 4 protein [Patescibacteria group bacterium]